MSRITLDTVDLRSPQAERRRVDVREKSGVEEEALANLRDALELHFTPPVATEKPQMHDIEIDIRAA